MQLVCFLDFDFFFGGGVFFFFFFFETGGDNEWNKLLPSRNVLGDGLQL